MRLPRFTTCMRVLQCSLALVLALQGLIFATSDAARAELAAAGVPGLAAIAIGGAEFGAALALLHDRWVAPAVSVLLLTFLSVAAVHLLLGRANFLNLVYASAALLAVLTFRRETAR